MAKKFNISGTCLSDRHYMVNLSSRLEKIGSMVDNGEYFVVNRARQYGKTTTLWALRNYLENKYAVILMSFQRMSQSVFSSEQSFCSNFARDFCKVAKALKVEGLNDNAISELDALYDSTDVTLSSLFDKLSEVCRTSSKKIVLIIDEVDSASNNQVFIDFLAQLRDQYLYREVTPAFHSVILAGVYDVRNLKLKLRSDDEHKYNSPWNIAVPFTVDMSFSPEDISGMLSEYEKDKSTGMNIRSVANLIFDYTSGYPFLVSRICKFIDETPMTWDEQGIESAVKQVLNEQNTLFDDMIKKLNDYPEVSIMLQKVLFEGQPIAYNPDNEVLSICEMFGFMKQSGQNIVVSNRIFETRLYNYFISKESFNTTYISAVRDKNQFIDNGKLDMDLVMEKFTEHFTQVYGDNDSAFVEEMGRKLFLLYLRPIINGTGNYYIEAQTRDMQRTDVIVDYLGTQYIIELKIWRGDEYNKRGQQQLAGYLDYYKQDKGWLLSFNFNKNKSIGVKTIECCGKTIVEAVV